MSTYPILKEWRKNTKQKLVEALGSCCQICSYRKCNQILELHHIDPTKKDFHMSQMNRQSWLRLKKKHLSAFYYVQIVIEKFTQVSQIYRYLTKLSTSL